MRKICVLVSCLFLIVAAPGQQTKPLTCTGKVVGEQTGTSSSRAWYILRQWNVGPLLLGLTQRLGKVITSSQRSDRVWTGMDQGGSFKLDIAVEGDVTSDIFIGFFKDSTWSTEPVQVRSFPQAGQYTIENLPPGKFQIGALIGTLPVATALGVHRTWPEPVEIKPGVTIEAEVLVSQDFQRRASGWYNQEVSRDFIGDWKDIDTDNLLQGRVTGPASQPIPFAEILIREYNPGASGIMAPNHGTNELGYYKYDGMKWPYRVSARWRELLPYTFGYRYQHLALNQAFEGPQMINFQFEGFPPGTATVTGRVADQHGNPVKEFFLDLGTWPEYFRKTKIPDGKYYNVVGYDIPFTANDGTFKLSGVPTGFFSIRAIPFKIQAYQLQRGQEATLEAGKTTNINLEVIAKNIFYGRVVFKDGNPAVVKPAPWPGAKTSIIMPMGRGRRASGVANVDDDGYFAAYLNEREIEQLRSGNSSLIINVPTEQEGRKSMGKFPFELLAKDKSKAGLLKIERPMGERPSLVDKPLPKFEGIEIKFSAEQAKGKKVLACFWDMQQRPSRNCLRQLSTRTQELKAKDIVVVAVQASKIDENALNEWLKKYKIPFPVGMIQGNEEKIRFTWGVRSLPWLILTDRKHIVRAEGFAISELDQTVRLNTHTEEKSP